MELTCYKRYRMTINLSGRKLVVPPTPLNYHFQSWDNSLLDAFAHAKYMGFRGEMDIDLFPCLANFEGCRRLMSDIARRPGFLPHATWLVAYLPPGAIHPEYCGAIQGVQDEHGLGAIQNLCVAADHRRNGLGTALLLRAIDGFRQQGISRAYLEVTAENHTAIRLYHRVGFVTTRIVYKPVETEHSS